MVVGSPSRAARAGLGGDEQARTSGCCQRRRRGNDEHAQATAVGVGGVSRLARGRATSRRAV
jgi:hypothetical protein